jgi:hypothetical protein
MMLKEIDVEILDDWCVLIFRLRTVNSDKLRQEIILTSLAAIMKEWSLYFDDLNLLSNEKWEIADKFITVSMCSIFKIMLRFHLYNKLDCTFL